MLPEFVFDGVKMEGNPFTFPEVKTLLDGITVGGHPIQHHDQIMNLRNGFLLMMALVESAGPEAFFQPTAWISLNSLALRGEAREVGSFRSGEVGVSGAIHPLPRAAELPAIFEREIPHIAALENPLEQAYLLAAWGMLNLFFEDGNKRTSRLTMNGVLLGNGLDALTIPAADQLEYNEACLEVFNDRSANRLFSFMLRRHQDIGLRMGGESAGPRF